MRSLKGIENNHDYIAIVAPSSPFNKELFLDGIKKLEQDGFRIKYSERIFNRGWNTLSYFAGSPEERASEIMEYFKDPSIKAIIAARGGYGANMVADYLDYDVIQKNPKIFMGFSDLTFLLTAINKKTNMTTFHGPMVGTYRFLPMIDKDFEIFRMVLHDPSQAFQIPFQKSNLKNPSVIEGTLVGGNLTLLATMTGTSYDFSTDDKIIFVEDTNEAGYKIDRMLTHLKQAGKFKRAKGLIFGEMLACGITKEIIFQIANNLNLTIPILVDFPVGHGERNVVMPIGGTCQLLPSKGILEIRGTS